VPSLLERALLAAHVLSSAAWFGALVYRAFFVDPAARRFFGRGGDYERFALHLADGMRYVVLAALLTCGLSGLGLLALRWPAASAAYLGLMAGKAALWAVALAVFAYISWVFWPRRVFAVEAEQPAIHRHGVALALTMIALAGLSILLGQLGRA
jgi:putative copper export protein